MIYVLGADHVGYVKRLEAVMDAVSGSQARAVVKLCALVKLLRGGEPVKMSKRAGDLVALRDVVDEVGSDVVRFMMLNRKNEAELDFDFEKLPNNRETTRFFTFSTPMRGSVRCFRNAAEELGADANERGKIV